MKTKQIYILLLVIIVAAVTGLYYKEGYNREALKESDLIIIRVGHTVNEETPIHIALLDFKKNVEDMSNGRIEVQIFPNGILGGDRQNAEACIIGYLNATAPPMAVLAGFDPTLMVVDLPFVFSNRESAYKALDNELGAYINERLARLDLISLGFSETGYRYITNDKHPIYAPEDLKGMKIRTMENPTHMQSFRLWGANPTPMNFAEVFTSLQQGTIDGQENPAQVIRSSRFFEVQKYMSLTGHFFSAGSMTFNKTFFDNLPVDLQEILITCSDGYIQYSRKLIAELEEKYIKELEEAGMEVNTLTAEQKQVFADAAKPVYDTFRNAYKNGAQLIEYATMYN